MESVPLLRLYSHGNNTLELVWTAVPSAVFIVLFLISASTWANIKIFKPKGDVEVRLIAKQFAWEFYHPGPDGLYINVPLRWQHGGTPGVNVMGAWVANTMAGSALVDRFDTVQRNTPTLPTTPTAPTAPTASPSEGAAPPRLLAPDGPADDLTCIKGIGPKRADKLNALGIFHFTQIAGWTDAEARWVDDQLAIPGRVLRERWIDQAQLLLTGGDETRH